MSLFGPEHESLRLEIRSFVEGRLAPFADEWEERRQFPRSVFEDLGARGYLGLTRSPTQGGGGLDFSYGVVLAEEVVRCRMGGLSLSILAQANFFLPLLERHGTSAQKDQFLGPAIRGRKIGALASTEPAGGSDISGATTCHAEDAGDFWVISGEKKYITNGPIADFIVTLVRTREGGGPNGLSLVIIPTNVPGFTVKATLKKLGLNTSPTGWLAFDHCRIPKDLTLGRPNLGYHYHTQNLFEERLIGGVSGLAMARLVLHDTIQYLKQRQAYGRPLSKLQTVRHRVAEMAAELEMARNFVYASCEDFRDGRVDGRTICMIKFQVVDIVQRVIERCIQLFGAYGFMEENWVTRAYRDARVLSLGGGTSEVMKDLVATYLKL